MSEQHPTPRRVGRLTPGRKPNFSKQQVIDAAIAEGIATFTLKGVASHLGVRPSAMYRIFASREELQAAAIMHLFSQVTLIPTDTATWQEGLRHMVDAQWELLICYPGLATAFLQNRQAQVLVMPHATQAIRQIASLGIPGGTKAAAFAMDFIGDTVLVTVVSMELYLDDRTHEVDPQAVEDFAHTDDPFGIQHLGQRGFLDRKVDFIIAGMEQHILPETRGANP